MSIHDRAMQEFSLPVKVYIEDTDAGGIVYHANYLKYMERSRSEFMAQLGYAKAATLDSGRLLVVHSMNIEFARAAVLGDQLQAITRVEKAARSYVAFEQRVCRDTDMLCRAVVKVACVHKKGMKPTAMPSDLRSALQSSLA